MMRAFITLLFILFACDNACVASSLGQRWSKPPTLTCSLDEDTAEEVARSLVRAFLSAGVYVVPYKRSGDSMRPFSNENMYALVKPGGYENLEIGMCVAFFDGHQDVLHQIIKKTKGGWITKGMNCLRPDSQILTKENYLGELVSGIWYENK